MKLILPISTSLILSALAITTLFGADPTGAVVTGKLYLSSLALPRANVQLTRDGVKSIVTPSVTAPDGTFSFTNVPTGNWTLKVTPEAGWSRYYAVKVDSDFIKVDPIHLAPPRFRTNPRALGFIDLRMRAGPGMDSETIKIIPENVIVEQTGPAISKGTTKWVPIKYTAPDGSVSRGYSTATALVPE